MSKFFNLISKKIYNSYNSSPQLSRLHNSLLMSIVETPKKYLYNVEVKSDTHNVNFELCTILFLISNTHPFLRIKCD